MLVSSLLVGGLLLLGVVASEPSGWTLTGRAAASELYGGLPGQPPLRETPLPDKPLPPYHDDFVLPPSSTMRVNMEILVGGRSLRTVEYAGRTYLPVPRLGTEYEIRITNYGPRRITAIVSVDGLSVINGRPASESQPGYIVNPGSSVRIKGWRRDMETVAAFRFEDREHSYASRSGRPENIGVIGLIAIEEMAWRPPPIPMEKDSAAPATARWSGAEVGGTGTGYGREIDSRIYYVPFVRSHNRRTITIYYDTVEALRGAGVPVDSPLPIPFPGATEFVPPPPSR